MVVTLLCTSRSGSTNLSNYLSGVLNLPLIQSPFMRGEHDLSEMSDDGFYKIFIHNQTRGFDSLYLFGEEVINLSDKVIIYDRLNKQDQSESLAYKQIKYSRDLTKYHIKEHYDMSIVPQEKIDECKFHFSEHSFSTPTTFREP